MYQVSGRALISGSGLSTIDLKGRVAIPPVLRNAIIANNTSSSGSDEDVRRFWLGRHDSAKALIGYDQARLDVLNANIEAGEQVTTANGGNFINHETRQRLFPSAEPVPFDGSGRFILSPKYKARGDLQDLAYFYGLGNIFAIWNPQLLLASDHVSEEIKEDCLWELKEKGLA